MEYTDGGKADGGTRCGGNRVVGLLAAAADGRGGERQDEAGVCAGWDPPSSVLLALGGERADQSDGDMTTQEIYLQSTRLFNNLIPCFQ